MISARSVFCIFTLFLGTITVFAQKGTIRGRVLDDQTGEPLIGATVVIAGTTTGSATDLDGDYTLPQLVPGNYDLQYSFVSYQMQKIVGVEVREGAVTIMNISLSPASQKLDEIVVSAEIIRNSEEALMTMRRKSINVIDGISSQSFRKIGDSNASVAIQRVSGVSVYGGKYVYVRGLGDRYSKTMLNSIDVPGLDPDRNALQIDIFPTSVIDNMLVIKSFTADLPADFTGGVVNIETKAFAEEKIFMVTFGLGYNPSMHFQNNYLTQKGGNFDFLGFDDGSRSRPIARGNKIPSPVLNDPKLELLTRRFNSALSAVKKTSFINYNMGISLSNQLNLKTIDLGYSASLNYRNTTNYYDKVYLEASRKSNDPDQYALQVDRAQVGPLGSNNVLMSGLLGVAIKTKKSKFKLNFLRLQNGESRASTFVRNFYINASNTVFSTNLDYSERTISNIILQGEHALQPNPGKPLRFEVNWKFSPTWAKVEDKDVRQTPYRMEEGTFSIEPSESGDPIRIWRFLDETNYVGRWDVVMNYKIKNRKSKMKWGVSETYKQRNFSIDQYRMGVLIRNHSNFTYTGDPNELMSDSFLWTPEKPDGSRGDGTYVRGNFEVANSFDATQNIFGMYLSNEVDFFDKLNLVVGVRMEQFDHWYTGKDQAYASGDIHNGIFFKNENLLSSLQFFPSLNLTYALSERMNLRMIYAGTVARPSFKEKSIAQIFDPITDRTFIGNIDLVETRIDNYDIRWEWFQQGEQNISFSVFYKNFTNPIELVSFRSDPRSYQPRNVSKAAVYGLEIEARKNLSFISSKMKPWLVGFNVSWIHSEVQMSDEEYKARLSFQRTGEVIKKTRNLQGQSPFLINVSMRYECHGLESILAYNVQGERLSIVGINAIPDVFDRPFHALDFKINKIVNLKEGGEIRIGLGIKNILGSIRESVAKSYSSQDRIFSSFDPERTIRLSFSYSF